MGDVVDTWILEEGCTKIPVLSPTDFRALDKSQYLFNSVLLICLVEKAPSHSQSRWSDEVIQALMIWATNSMKRIRRTYKDGGGGISTEPKTKSWKHVHRERVTSPTARHQGTSVRRGRKKAVSGVTEARGYPVTFALAMVKCLRFRILCCVIFIALFSHIRPMCWTHLWYPMFHTVFPTAHAALGS